MMNLQQVSCVQLWLQKHEGRRMLAATVLSMDHIEVRITENLY